jgi:LPXTG-motif cell wall-anchored protein
MKKIVSTATALSTAILIALGGVALTGTAASAESAATEEGTVPATVTETVVEPGSVPDDAEQPAPPVEPGVEDPVGSADGAGPADDEAAVVVDGVEVGPAVAADVVARAATFALTSPQQGAVYPTVGYELVIETTEPIISYELFDSAGASLGGGFEAPGPRVSRTVFLDDAAPADQSMTVVVEDAQGVVIGSETRSFRVEVPVSPAVTITSPRQGEVVRTSATSWPGGGSFVLEGTAVAGSWLHYSYEALSGQTGWGGDYDAPVVSPDGTWSIGDGLPLGSWRATVRQYVGVGDPALGGEAGPPLSRASAPVTVDFTLTAPLDVAAPIDPVVVPDDARPVAGATRPAPVAARSVLASTGSSETMPWAALAGTVLVGLGAASVLVARRRASRG